MAFPPQAKWKTPVVTPTTTVLFLNFPYDGELTTEARYNITNQSGADGNLARKIDKKERIIEIIAIATQTQFNLLKPKEGDDGKLTIRGRTIQAKLLNADRIRGIEATGWTLDGTDGDLIATAWKYIQFNLKFIIENQE